MRFKLKCTDATNDYHKRQLADLNLVYDDLNFDYLILPRDETKILVRGSLDNYIYVSSNSIVRIESRGRYNYIFTLKKESYQIDKKLYELENILGVNFSRISKYCIVDLRKIVSIVPTINMRFVLELIDSSKVIVTRTYYKMFKNIIERGVENE
jgi:DNA-binding LytR/AlgR family response regulator